MTPIRHSDQQEGRRREQRLRKIHLPPLIQALLRPSAYSHGAHRVRLAETHISWVLLTGAYAYKVKKPVKLPFLDFSSLQLRLDACREELRLNRRFAPELYLDVVPITGSAEHPLVGGEGVPLEYAVKMRQFPADRQLDRVLDAGGLSPRDMEQFGRSLAALHATLPSAAAGTEYGLPSQVQTPLRDSLHDLLQGTGDDALRSRLEQIGQWVTRRGTELAPVFDARRLAGCVRECHGDLHLANLVSLDQGIVPFDCIEFSPGLRWIDTVSDTAFLLMDLAHRGHPGLGYAFLNGYLEAGGDYAGVRTLHYYAVYRALVRAKVAMIRWQSLAVDKRRRQHLDECIDYVRQALYWTRRARPGLILMHGLAGSGKTRYSGELAERLPAIRVRSDVERKRMHGIAPQGRSGSGVGAGIYTVDAGRQVYSHLVDLARALIEGGETAIIDATFLHQAARRHFAALAQQLDVPMAIVDCQAPPAELERRLVERAREGKDASEADVAVLRHQLGHNDPLDDAERAHTLTVDTTRAPPFDALLAQLRTLLGR
ncbi:MAG: AAA family ATPase [Nevskia sp.]|nr:AAA family ATPase [Nevskia sp.]